MALSEQIAAYPDCEKLYESAASAPAGARAEFSDYSAAALFRLRMNHYRVLLRRESKRLYETDDPRYGKCEFDRLICRLREDEANHWWVYCEPHGQEILSMETIGDDESFPAEQL